MQAERREECSDKPAGESGVARPVVAAFDLDGTLTRRDTLKPFLVRAFGWRRVAWTFLQLTPWALRVAAGRARVDDFKVRALRRLFAGEDPARLRAVGLVHARAVKERLRPAALARIEWHRAQGHCLVLASAAIDVYVEPLARSLAFDHVACTRLAVVAGAQGDRYDGSLAGEDCTGAGKVRLVEALLGPLSRLELHAYGDSPGDRELLAAARRPHWRPFR
jgi:HAD superfamily hydrolase (TIGR01490 family)